MEERRDAHAEVSGEFETRVIHGGRGAGGDSGAIVPPIVQSATFEISSVQAGAELMRGERPGSVYTRLGNPTTSCLEEVLADLELGAGALVTASGMAAAATVLFALAQSGDQVVAAQTIYGGTRQLLLAEGRRFGVHTAFVDPRDPAGMAQALEDGPRLVWIESPANPNLELTDIAAVAEVAHAAGALVVIDNTFATPFLQRPLTLGADVVVHSLTKALNGHSDVVAGAIVARDAGLLSRLRNTRTHLGGVADPHQAWLVLRGLRTLPMRVRVAQENAGRLAALLSEHAAVDRVRYPGFLDQEERALMARQMAGPGSMLAFEVAGGANAATRVVERLRLITLAGSLGGLESLAMHPASMSHIAMSREQLAAAGIEPSLVRLSVGCEHVEDLAEDLRRALDPEV